MGLVFHRNLPVIPTRLVKSYKDPEFARELQGGASALPPAPVAARSGLGQVFATAFLAALMFAGLLVLAAAVHHAFEEEDYRIRQPFIAPAGDPPLPVFSGVGRPLPYNAPPSAGLHGRVPDPPYGRSMGVPPGPFPASRAVPPRPRGRSRSQRLPGQSGYLIRIQ